MLLSAPFLRPLCARLRAPALRSRPNGGGGDEGGSVTVRRRGRRRVDRSGGPCRPRPWPRRASWERGRGGLVGTVVRSSIAALRPRGVSGRAGRKAPKRHGNNGDPGRAGAAGSSRPRRGKAAAVAFRRGHRRQKGFRGVRTNKIVGATAELRWGHFRHAIVARRIAADLFASEKAEAKRRYAAEAEASRTTVVAVKDEAGWTAMVERRTRPAGGRYSR